LRLALSKALLFYIVKRKYIRSFRKELGSCVSFVRVGRALQSVGVA
jgi:hypothetical protein